MKIGLTSRVASNGAPFYSGRKSLLQSFFVALKLSARLAQVAAEGERRRRRGASLVHLYQICGPKGADSLLAWRNWAQHNRSAPNERTGVAQLKLMYPTDFWLSENRWALELAKGELGRKVVVVAAAFASASASAAITTAKQALSDLCDTESAMSLSRHVLIDLKAQRLRVKFWKHCKFRSQL